MKLLPEISYHPDNLFLTDGKSEIRYGDIAWIHGLVQDKMAEIAKNKFTVAIDTGNRMHASIWMVLCWMQNIPFVPFQPSHPEILQSFRTDKFADEIIRLRDHIGHTNLHKSASGQYPFTGEFRNTALNPFHYPEESVFCGLLTSGSSGEPRRVPLQRRQMISAARNAARYGITGLWGNCLPLFHAGGLAIVFRAFLTGAGVYIWDRYEAASVCRDLRNIPEVRRISLVPTMLKRILDHTATDSSVAAHSLDHILVGGGPAPAGLIHKARTQGWPVIFSYGMTETCGQVAAQNPDGTSPADSVGTPFTDHIISVRNDGGQEIPAGHSGTIWIQGPQVFDGYLPEGHDLYVGGKPDGPAAGRKDLPHINTGDFGHFDGEGNLYIEARRTDLVISGGENIRPAEIEEMLLTCPLVSDAGVTGIPDDDWGQRLTALIVLSEEAGDFISSEIKTAISDFLSERLKPYQQPKSLCLVDAIPRTALGKIKRKKLQDLATTLLAEK